MYSVITELFTGRPPRGKLPQQGGGCGGVGGGGECLMPMDVIDVNGVLCHAML